MTDAAQQIVTLLSAEADEIRAGEHRRFEDLVSRHQGQLVLFGAGSAGRTAARNLIAAGVRPRAFADNNHTLWGTAIEGIPVLSPSEAAQSHGASALFVVSIYSQGHVFRTTLDQLRSLGVRSVVSDSAMRWRFAETTLPFFCHDLPHKVFAEKDRIASVAELWSDARSASEYVNQINWRATGDLGVLEPPTAEESYFPPSLLRLRPGEYFVDCGAYTGDTAQRVIDLTGAQFQQILALEPDPSNFETFQRWQNGLPQSLSSKITGLNSAVSDRECELSFSTQATALQAEGTVTVRCQRLDDLLHDAAPTFIKMDIEGAELDAIAGARNIIRQHRPVLSICVYHRQSDIWEIPLAVKALGVDYRYYLRAHEGDGWQTVLYAIPPERAVS